MLLLGFEDWIVVYMFGYSWDSCCFYYVESGVLFCGDILFGSLELE